MLNVLDTLPKKAQGHGKVLLAKIPYAETREEAQRLTRAFANWCERRGHRDAARVLDQDWERIVTFYAFSQPHWKHLRTTNPVESPLAAVRLRTTAAKRDKKVEQASAVIWKTWLMAEQPFRRLDAPELLAEVAEGATYVNDVRVMKRNEEAAA